MDQGKLDELLQKSVTLYVPAQHREAALATFRMMVQAARAEGATDAASLMTGIIRKAEKK